MLNWHFFSSEYDFFIANYASLRNMKVFSPRHNIAVLHLFAGLRITVLKMAKDTSTKIASLAERKPFVHCFLRISE